MRRLLPGWFNGLTLLPLLLAVLQTYACVGMSELSRGTLAARRGGRPACPRERRTWHPVNMPPAVCVAAVMNS